MLNTQRGIISKKFKERREFLVETGAPPSEFSKDPEIRKLRQEIESFSPREDSLKYEIYTIELADILQSKRTRNIYNQVLEAETYSDAAIIIREYKDSLLNEARESRILNHDGEVMKSIEKIERVLHIGTLIYERDNRNDRIYYRGNRRAPKGGDSEN